MWSFKTATYIVVCILIIVALCAITPLARFAILVGAIVGLFLLPATYYPVDGRMTVKGDLLFAGTTALFTIFVVAFSPLACTWLGRFSNASCDRTAGLCLIVLIPCLVITFFTWLGLRLSQWFRSRT